MRQYVAFQRSAQDHKVLDDSGYPWTALLFSPLWAFCNGLIFHGVVLAVLFGLCALLMGVATNGIIVGVAIALGLGAFTAHNATDWLTSSFEKQGYKRTGRVEAGSLEQALRAHREPKRPTVLLETASSGQLGENLTVKPAKIGA